MNRLLSAYARSFSRHTGGGPSSAFIGSVGSQWGITRRLLSLACFGLCLPLLASAVDDSGLPSTVTASAPVSAIKLSLPANGAQNVSPSQPIMLHSNDAIDPSSVSAESVTLLGPEGAVSTDVSCDGVSGTITLQPRADLFPASRYDIVVKGLVAADGTPIPLATLSFTTASLKTPPSEASGERTFAIPDATNSIVQNAHAVRAAQDAPGSDVHSDPDRWLPTADNRNGRWRTGRPLPSALALRRNEAMAPQSLAPGGVARTARAAGTAVTGIVLRQSDTPLPNVNITIGGVNAVTDANGEFKMLGLHAGHQELIVDGRRAGDAVSQFGYFVIGVDIVAGKDTEIAPIYLPKILATDWVDLPSPIDKDTVVTTPLVPGMEIHVPKGAVLRDREGSLVTKIALIPMPLDRMPFPFPENAPVYVGVQPGGMVVQGLTPGTTQGITVRYPNQSDLAPGTRVDFWNYNTDERSWQIYGGGQVSTDEKQVVPDQGVALYESVGFMFTYQNPPPPPDAPPPDGCGGAAGGGPGFGGAPGFGGGPGAGGGPGDGGAGGGNGDGPSGGSGGGSTANNETGGDPVDCKSGLFVLERMDARANGIIPIEVRRTYRPGDPTVRAFGYGANHGYAMYLRDPLLNGQSYQNYDLILPNGSFVRFHRTSPGNDYPSVVAIHDDSASGFYGAILDYESGNYVVTTKEGTKYIFPISGLLSAIRDRHGNTITISRNGGQITRLTAAGGRYIDFTYDGTSRVTQMTDIAGRNWNYQYSPNGFLSKVTYPDGLHEDYAYDSNGRMLTLTDRKGVVAVTNVYDANGRVSQQTLADGGIYHFAYTLDANGKVTQTDVTDPLSHVKRVTYDSHGYKASVTRAYGTALAQTTTYVRESVSGLLTAMVDALGRRTEWQRDLEGNITETTRLAGTPNANMDSATYTTDFNLLASVTDPRGKTTTFTFDNQGNRLTATDPLSHQHQFTYNAAGQMLTIKDALSNTTTFAYDPTGDMRSVSDPLGRTWKYYIDGLGRRVGIVDPLGRKSLWTYDALGRVVTATDPLDQNTILGYDGNSNLLTVTDPNGGTTHFGYDGRNRRTSRTDALNQTESWTFDDNGNPLSFQDREGQTTHYHYDVLDRRSDATYADGSTVDATYDLVDRLVGIDDSLSGAISRSFDDLNRMLEEQTPQGTVDYAYDAAGRRTQMTAASQTPIAYAYDDANRLTAITQGAESVGFAYDASNRRTHVTLPNGVDTQATFDAASELTALDYASVQGVVLGAVDYGYDNAGQRTSRNVDLAGISEPLPNETTGTNGFDLNNRQTQYNGASIGYDDNGDSILDSTPSATSYTFDTRHRLVQMQRGGTTIASFQYDPFGRRIAKTIGGTTTTFLYDGANPIQETQGTTVSPLLTGVGIDERYARTEAAGRRYFLTDALGSTLALTDQSGATTQTYSYEPFGEVQTTGTSANPYQYTGQENDGTGLYYYRARYYNPALKRFISEDPIGLTSGLNQYAYVKDDPLSRTDPTGLIDAAVCALSGGTASGCGNMNASDWMPPPPNTSSGDCGCTKELIWTQIRNRGVRKIVEYGWVELANPEIGLPTTMVWAIIKEWYEYFDAGLDTKEYIECVKRCRECDN